MRCIIEYFKPVVWCWMLLHMLTIPAVYASEKTASGENPAQVMEQFNKSDSESSVVNISDRRKQQVMFLMGITLLVFIATTVSLGVAMGGYAKRVFVAHMIFAGFSLTLAVAHAIVAIVWFFPK